MVISGHTHTSYVCDIPDPAGQPRLVTSAASFGRLYTDFEGSYDRRTHDFVRSVVTARERHRQPDVAEGPGHDRAARHYRTLLGPIANRVVGYITADILGRGATTLEEPLGDVIADAQLEATAAAVRRWCGRGVHEPGRHPLRPAVRPERHRGRRRGDLQEAFTVQPFNNLLETLTLTGAQIVTLLQQQYSGANATHRRCCRSRTGSPTRWI